MKTFIAELISLQDEKLIRESKSSERSQKSEVRGMLEVEVGARCRTYTWLAMLDLEILGFGDFSILRKAWIKENPEINKSQIKNCFCFPYLRQLTTVNQNNGLIYDHYQQKCFNP
ncbi:hypothetical protein A4R26_19895 [Niastella populi]|uniref:Uncharacterized protein n=1 Tax=Niastella populi TaxID=550983 RepID=A0A1V9FPD8_9BACT|nr:hypothetical protein A4R26_19895 [Niastella populi]